MTPRSRLAFPLVDGRFGPPLRFRDLAELTEALGYGRGGRVVLIRGRDGAVYHYAPHSQPHKWGTSLLLTGDRAWGWEVRRGRLRRVPRNAVAR